MIRQKRPGINLNTTFFREKSESGKKIVPILIGQEDQPFLDAPTHDMMEDSRSI
jgi:hypothetical protein